MKKSKIIEVEEPVSLKSTKDNKTGSWRTLYPLVDKKKCIGCKICQKFCPDSCIQIINGKSVIDLDYCKGCGICEVECPVKAIRMEEEEK